VRDRERAIKRVEAMLRRLSADPSSGVAFVEGSRWMTVYEETSYLVRYIVGGGGGGVGGGGFWLFFS
jgi:hypothetical protein